MAEKQYFQSDDPQDLPPPAPQNRSWLMYALLGLAAAVLIITFMRGSGRQRPVGENHPAVGKTVERLQLEALTGDAPPVTLASLQGKVTVVNFWGTWCPPCREEFPHVIALWQKHRDQRDFQLAAVSCEPGLEKDIDALRDTTASYLAEMKTEMPTYYDPQALTRIAVDDATGQLAFPATMVLDRTGKIGGYWVGYRPGVEDEIETLVERLLSQP